MYAILLCTVIGFLAGLGYVMWKRKLKPGPVLWATLLGLISATALKGLKDYLEKKKNIYY
jgi:hypothetical protein